MDILEKHWRYYMSILVLGVLFYAYTCIYATPQNAYASIALAFLSYDAINTYHIAGRFLRFTNYGIILHSALPYVLFLYIMPEDTQTIILTSVTAIIISSITDLLTYKEKIVNIIRPYLTIRGILVYTLIIIMVLSHFTIPSNEVDDVHMNENRIDTYSTQNVIGVNV